MCQIDERDRLLIRNHFDYLTEGIPSTINDEIKSIIVNSAITYSYHKDVLKILPPDFWYSFYIVDKGFKFDKSYIDLKKAKLDSPEFIYTKSIKFDDTYFYYTDKKLPVSFGLIKNGYLTIDDLDTENIIPLLAEKKMDDLKSLHNIKIRSKIKLIQAILDEYPFDYIVVFFKLSKLKYLNFSDKYKDVISAYYDLDRRQELNVKVMLHTISFKFTTIQSALYYNNHGVKRVEIYCVGDVQTCDYCKRQSRFIRTPVTLDQLPPFKHCNHRKDCGCRCSTVSA